MKTFSYVCAVVILLLMFPAASKAAHVDRVEEKEIEIMPGVTYTYYVVHYTDGRQPTIHNSYPHDVVAESNNTNPGGSGDPAGVPIDGGIGFLLAAGLGYGGKQLYQRRKKANGQAHD
ncbi:PID-CTERM protein-sorting domain-containing protein [Pedobacter sp. SYSU D00535]|uniref:PID-CTERM protein-sorting domain-containing protein n=1 Tax=Pedobacter sp. SYSU D00535 TaxID=2810308 RepID=UPI001A97959D|nr:hypothetical protein [Pedobacter sp. SYSU D00535]